MEVHPRQDADEPAAGAALATLYRRLSAKRRRQSLAVLGWMLAGGIAELVTIGALIPFLALLSGTVGSNWPAVAILTEWLRDVGGELALVLATSIFAIAAFVAAGVRLQLAWSSQRFVFEVGHDLSLEIQRRVLRQPFQWHLQHNSSEIIASLGKVEMLVGAVILQLLQAIGAAVIGLFILAALLAAAPLTALATGAAFAFLYWLVARLTRRRLRRNSAVVSSAFEQRIRLLQECLGGIRDVILDRSQASFLDSFRRIDRALVDARSASLFIATAPRFVIEAAGIAFLAALALVLSSRDGGVVGALPIIGALALGAQRLLPLVQQLYRAQAIYAGNRAVAADVVALLRLPVPADESGAADALPFDREIRLENVSFTYPGRTQPALDGISLIIPRGSKVALAGPTGAGKSTLADMLMGLIEPGEGSVLIDGTRLDAESRTAWYRNIAHVPQNIFLADVSIAENIALGSGDVDIARAQAAARAAQLDMFVEELPEGYETMVGERGVRLSGGQRQRLALARALYKDAPLLVLDEATSSLDDITEAAVLDALDALHRDGRTIIVIAHSERTIARCDQVIRLSKGRLAERSEQAA